MRTLKQFLQPSCTLGQVLVGVWAGRVIGLTSVFGNPVNSIKQNSDELGIFNLWQKHGKANIICVCVSCFHVLGSTSPVRV